MPKLYWSVRPDGDNWAGPFETDEECLTDTECYPWVDSEIWIAPVDAKCDDDDAFWAEVAALTIIHANRELIDEELAIDGWIDAEEPFVEWDRKDRSGILANALRQVLGPRPEWRSVDTSKARRVEL